MKIGEISRPNSKGQIVIPKRFRDELGITADVPVHIIKRGHGLYLYPIRDVTDASAALNDGAYVHVLKRTQGAWSGDNWPATASRQSRIEKRSAQKGKRAW